MTVNIPRGRGHDDAILGQITIARLCFSFPFFLCRVYFKVVKHKEGHSVQLCKTGGVTGLGKKKTAICYFSTGPL